ncbi:MAG: bifunctional phosphopantothenoylcysteine decarboxylase/phosphopantothenate synthase, partial [Nitratireductor sp.]|nr:bifunctional phosphopantothenoylcysteine decarboxylase/phosphopantothenate synthase [Nitratireductor sp.]
AAVADWRSKGEASEKMKKEDGKGPSHLELTENPDILKTIGHHENRPQIVVGFAAETHNVETHARAKLKRKGADWIVANDVSPDSGIGGSAGGVMGGDANRVKIISAEAVEEWPELSKHDVAVRLAARIAAELAKRQSTA